MRSHRAKKVVLIVGAFVTIVFLVLFSKIYFDKGTFEGDIRTVKVPLIIFDFDGTICDSFMLFMNTLNEIADEYGLNKVSEAEIEGLRDFSSKQILKKYGVSTVKLPFVVRRMRKQIRPKVSGLSVVKEVDKALKEISEMNVTIGILTSNSAENVQIFLSNNNLNIFEFIHSGSSIFGKARLIKKILRDANLQPGKDLIVYVGDETRDVQAAKKAGVKSVAVSWGFNSVKALEKTDPDYLVERQDKLVDTIKIIASHNDK